ncbi:MAG: hypothetical protein OEW19_13535 [Acidobacteriota bacterium]|nr:hypothetical protein [Acidobacteriota bacterium]
MGARARYVKRSRQVVVAVPLALETEGFTYRKWGDLQTCKAGDWVVDNAGDVYTVDRTTFARTYRQVGPGTFVKTTPVWAEIAAADGRLTTKEGATHYRAGDYLVCNEEDGSDAYAMSAEKFQAMYERAD